MIKKNIRAYCALLTLSLAVVEGVQAQSVTDTVPPADNDSLVHIAFRTVNKKDLLGAVSSVNVSDVLTKSYGLSSLDNLDGLVSGYTGNVWGQSPLILVDGIPRNAADVRMVEVQSVTVLKDATSVAMYGGAGSRGVVLITTKRGANKPLSIDVRANTGVLVPKRYPSYLNGAEYMTLYNEALRNDGIAERYTPEQIYRTSEGTNPYRYPDLNLLSSEYLKKMTSRSDITTEISGGNERARYYSNIGMAYNNDLLKLGEAKKNNDLLLRIRTNVDMNLTSWLTASADVSAIIDNNYAARGDFWGATATIRPNHDWFSPLIPIDMLDPDNPELQTIVENSNHVIDGKYLLGGLSTMQTNDLSQLIASGYIKDKNRAFMFNVSAQADLSSVVKGLRFSTRYSMDYTSRYTEGYNVPYATYEPVWQTIDGQEVITSLNKFGNDENSTSEFIGTSLYNQTTSITGQFDYRRTFNQNHHVTASLVGWGYMSQFSSDGDTNVGGSDYHPVRNTNLGIQAGYNFRHKYYVDFSGAVLHSTKLPTGNRQGFSPTATLGWRISEEDFFKNSDSFVDDLRLTVSYSALKQDLDITSDNTDYYLYSGNYGNNDQLGRWYQWRDGVAGGWTTLSGRGANPNLTFVERNEFRTGLDATLFNRVVSLNANYFHQRVNGLLTRGSSTVFPSYFIGPANGSFLPWLNYNNDQRTGVDFSINVNSKVGNVHYTAGFVGMVYDSKALRRDEVYEDDYQNRTGRPLDAYWGYLAEGLFQSQEEIDNHARQLFGGGEVKPGDIKYTDVNGDGVVDGLDQVDLGHNGWAVSPFTYGVNLTLKWKNLTLFAVGSGQSGAVAFKNDAYFWVRGQNKYSTEVSGRWTEETKNTATYPRLTTTGLNNNVQNSTFWMYKTNRFNLNRVQLTYDFSDRLFANSSVVNGLSVYINGDNLLVISEERKLMETNFGSAPQTRFFNFGVRASF